MFKMNVFYVCRDEFPPEIAEIDKLFKAGDCTITGGGIQDGLWGDLVNELAGNANNIRFAVI